jgi:glycosyltransferase involved in cell wall biosynthesis
MITLCICTYNRSESLREALNSVCRLRGLEKLGELLIIDNNSTDETANIVEAFASKLPIRRVMERAQGLSHARNRAIAEFKGETLLFTDDDVLLDPDWLSTYALALSTFPIAQFFGGRILPRWDSQPPGWLKAECPALLDGLLVWYDHGTETRPYSCDEDSPFGASFAVRRTLLEAMPGFRIDLGPRGASRGRGDDTEFLQRCRAAGVPGVYVGGALCWHRVDDRRLTLPALYRYGIESGRSHQAIARSAASGSVLRVPLHIARGFFQLFKGRGDRFRQCVINAGIEIGMRGTKLPASEAQ